MIPKKSDRKGFDLYELEDSHDVFVAGDIITRPPLYHFLNPLINVDEPDIGKDNRLYIDDKMGLGYKFYVYRRSNLNRFSMNKFHSERVPLK